MTVESKLQDTCSWKLKLVTQHPDIRSNDSEIFDDERQATQLAGYSCEKVRTRTLYPVARLGRWRARRYVPGGHKSAEVVQPNRIHVSQQGTDPIDGPSVAGGAKSIPVVNRISPQLSLRTEVVRRDASHKSRSAVLVQKE